jgi:hypothetical protein
MIVGDPHDETALAAHQTLHTGGLIGHGCRLVQRPVWKAPNERKVDPIHVRFVPLDVRVREALHGR